MGITKEMGQKVSRNTGRINITSALKFYPQCNEPGSELRS